MRHYERLYKLRFLFGGLFVVAIIFLLSLVLSSVGLDKVQAKNKTSSSSLSAGVSNSPNAITGGLSEATYSINQTLSSMLFATANGAHTVSTAIADGGLAAARGVKTGVTVVAVGVGKGVVAAGSGVVKGVKFTGSTVASGVGFVLRIPGNAVGFASDSSVVQAAIKPSDHEEIPIIDPNSPELHAALAALPPQKKPRPAAKPSSNQGGSGPAWPIHGRVTAAFGIPHWPFQATHTGIDISSGRGSGNTAVKPFRSGRVTETVHSSYGLGNHVIVDHGNGVTSVYAHLNSISVKKGQDVGLNTTLGYEGTTGLSTGTHLHFEVRVNGQAADPKKFVGGNP